MDSLKSRRNRAIKIIKILRQATESMQPTLSQSIKREFGDDPFLILISCLLSLRAKDIVTLPICRALFHIAITPQQILSIPLAKLERVIFKIGFYKNKAKTLHFVCRDLIKRFNSRVPCTRDELLSIKGIGIKTANLVLGEAFGIPAICVDTHVHRVSNRLGLIKTKTPEQTEKALQELLPSRYWVEWNPLMVMWGQNICTPLSPWCSKCVVYQLCNKVGVKRSR